MSTNGGSAGASSPVANSDDSDMDMDSDMTTNGDDHSDHEATPRPEPINENDPVRIMPFLGRVEQKPDRHDVCVVGAGPAGLMLGYVTLAPKTLKRDPDLLSFFLVFLSIGSW